MYWTGMGFVWWLGRELDNRGMVLRCPAGASHFYLIWSVRIGPCGPSYSIYNGAQNCLGVNLITCLRLMRRLLSEAIHPPPMSWCHDAWLSTLTFSLPYFHCSFSRTTRLSTETLELNFARIELSFSVAGKEVLNTWCSFSLPNLPFIGRLIKTSRLIELKVYRVRSRPITLFGVTLVHSTSTPYLSKLHSNILLLTPRFFGQVCIISRFFLYVLNEPGSAVGIATGLWKARVSNAGNFLFSKTSRSVLGPTQPPIQLVRGSFPGIKRPVPGVKHLPP